MERPIVGSQLSRAPDNLGHPRKDKVLQSAIRDGLKPRGPVLYDGEKGDRN
jgi:hypothetical protein